MHKRSLIHVHNKIYEGVDFMGKCNLDHSQTDVLKKFESQKEFLPKILVKEIESFLHQEQTQLDLNEWFHLLKKYDLATNEVKEERNKKIETLLNK